MAKKEFVYTITVETDGATQQVQKVAKSIDDFEEGIGQLRTELGKAPLGSKEFKDLNKRLKDAETQFEKAKLKSQSFGESMAAIPGPIGGVSQGIKGLGQTFKVLLANPIVLFLAAIVAGITALYKAFASTKAGGEAIARVMAGVSAAMDVLRDTVLELFSSWDNFKKIFTLDFWKNTANEIANEAKQAAQLTGELQKLEDQQRDLNVARAEQNRDLAKAKQLINDETLSYEERGKALDEVIEKEQKMLDEELKLQKARLVAMENLAAMSDSDAETLNKLAEQRIKIAQLEEQSANKQKEAADQRRGLRQREAAEAKAAADKRKQEMEQLAAFEEKLMLDLIESEDEKARTTLEIQRDADLEAIDDLKTTEQHKQELREQAQTKYLNSVAKLEEAITKKEKDEEEKRLANEKAAELERLNKKKSDLDILLGLQKVYNQQDLENLEALLLQKLNAELAAEGLTNAEILQIQEQYGQAMVDAQQSLLMKEKMIQDQKNALPLQGLEIFKQVVGEESKLGKGAAIAQALINTYLGVSEALKQESALPSPFDVIAKILNTASVLTTGLMAVRQIRSTPVPNMAYGGLVQGPGTSTSDSVSANLSNGESVINARSTNMFRPLLSAINQLGGGRPFDADINTPEPSKTGDMPVFKTYVVAGDVETQMQLDREVKSRSFL